MAEARLSSRSSSSDSDNDSETTNNSDGDELDFNRNNGVMLPYQGEPLAGSSEGEDEADDGDVDEDGLSVHNLAARYEGQVAVESW